MFASAALALLAAVRRLVTRLLRYGLEGIAPVGLRLLSPREGNVSLRSEGKREGGGCEGGDGVKISDSELLCSPRSH